MMLVPIGVILNLCLRTIEIARAYDGQRYSRMIKATRDGGSTPGRQSRTASVPAGRRCLGQGFAFRQDHPACWDLPPRGRRYGRERPSLARRIYWHAANTFA